MNATYQHGRLRRAPAPDDRHGGGMERGMRRRMEASVYLTQAFQQIEGLPLYRYQLQLRLARALDLLGDNADLTSLALDLGFSSHSHFSAAFKRAYGQTPSAFQRSARIR